MNIYEKFICYIYTLNFHENNYILDLNYKLEYLQQTQRIMNV